MKSELGIKALRGDPKQYNCLHWRTISEYSTRSAAEMDIPYDTPCVSAHVIHASINTLTLEITDDEMDDTANFITVDRGTRLGITNNTIDISTATVGSNVRIYGLRLKRKFRRVRKSALAKKVSIANPIYRATSIIGSPIFEEELPRNIVLLPHIMPMDNQQAENEFYMIGSIYFPADEDVTCVNNNTDEDTCIEAEIYKPHDSMVKWIENGVTYYRHQMRLSGLLRKKHQLNKYTGTGEDSVEQFNWDIDAHMNRTPTTYLLTAVRRVPRTKHQDIYNLNGTPHVLRRNCFARACTKLLKEECYDELAIDMRMINSFVNHIAYDPFNLLTKIPLRTTEQSYKELSVTKGFATGSEHTHNFIFDEATLNEREELLSILQDQTDDFFFSCNLKQSHDLKLNTSTFDKRDKPFDCLPDLDTIATTDFNWEDAKMSNSTTINPDTLIVTADATASPTSTAYCSVQWSKQASNQRTCRTSHYTDNEPAETAHTRKNSGLEESNHVRTTEGEDFINGTPMDQTAADTESTSWESVHSQMEAYTPPPAPRTMNWDLEHMKYGFGIPNLRNANKKKDRLLWSTIFTWDARHLAENGLPYDASFIAAHVIRATGSELTLEVGDYESNDTANFITVDIRTRMGNTDSTIDISTATVGSIVNVYGIAPKREFRGMSQTTLAEKVTIGKPVYRATSIIGLHLQETDTIVLEPHRMPSNYEPAENKYHVMGHRYYPQSNIRDDEAQLKPWSSDDRCCIEAEIYKPHSGMNRWIEDDIIYYRHSLRLSELEYNKRLQNGEHGTVNTALQDHVFEEMDDQNRKIPTIYLMTALHRVPRHRHKNILSSRSTTPYKARQTYFKRAAEKLLNFELYEGDDVNRTLVINLTNEITHDPAALLKSIPLRTTRETFTDLFYPTRRNGIRQPKQSHELIFDKASFDEMDDLQLHLSEL